MSGGVRGDTGAGFSHDFHSPHDEKTSSRKTMGSVYEAISAKKLPVDNLIVRTYQAAWQVLNGEGGAKRLSRDEWTTLKESITGTSRQVRDRLTPHIVKISRHDERCLKMINDIISKLDDLKLIPCPFPDTTARKPTKPSVSPDRAPLEHTSTVRRLPRPDHSRTEAPPIPPTKTETTNPRTRSETPIPVAKISLEDDPKTESATPPDIPVPVAEITLYDDPKTETSRGSSGASSVSIPPERKTPPNTSALLSGLQDRLLRRFLEPTYVSLHPEPVKPEEPKPKIILPTPAPTPAPTPVPTPKLQPKDPNPKPLTQPVSRSPADSIPQPDGSDSGPLPTPPPKLSPDQPKKLSTDQPDTTKPRVILGKRTSSSQATRTSLFKEPMPELSTSSPQVKSTLIHTDKSVLKDTPPLASSTPTSTPISIESTPISPESTPPSTPTPFEPSSPMPEPTPTPRDPTPTPRDPTPTSPKPTPTPTLAESFTSSKGEPVAALTQDSAEWVISLSASGADDSKLSSFEASRAIASFESTYGSQSEYASLVSVLSHIWLPSILKEGVSIGESDAHRALAYLKLFSCSEKKEGEAKQPAELLLEKLKASNPEDQMFWYCFQFALLKSTYEFAKSKLESEPSLRDFVAALEAPPFNISTDSYKLPDVFRSAEHSSLQSTTRSKAAIEEHLREATAGLDLTSLLDDPKAFRSFWKPNIEQIFTIV